MPLISVVDDDIWVRESLDSLIRSVGLNVSLFASAEEFLESFYPGRTDCLILDIRLPGMSGLELHHRLLARSGNVPVVFITAQGSGDGTTSEAASD